MTGPGVILPKLKPLLYMLIQNFLEGDYSQRRESAIALSKFKGEMVVSVLLQTYESDNIQDFMALALGDIDDQKAVNLLVQALNDSQYEVRFNAARALGSISSDEAFNVLIEALNEYADSAGSGVAQGRQGQLFLEEDAIISAIVALGKIKNQLCVPLMKRILNQEKSPRIRAAVITALGMMASERMLPIFQAALRDEDPRVRANAIESIESVKSSSIVGILQPYLEDASNRVRANVAKAIWKYGDFDVTETISRMLRSKDKWQRASGAYAMGEIKDTKFITKLAAALRDEDPDVRRNAAHALKKIQSPNALAALIPLLDDPNFDVRVQALLAISRCSPTKVGELFPPRLASEDNAIVRATIISTIGDCAVKTCFDALLPFLDDPDARVVANTIDALQKLSSQAPAVNILDKVKILLSHEDNRVKSNAIRALWHWNEFSVLDNLFLMIAHQDPKHRLSGTFVLGEIGIAISGNQALSLSVNNLIAELAAEKRGQKVPGDSAAPQSSAPVSADEKSEPAAPVSEVISADAPKPDQAATESHATAILPPGGEDPFAQQLELAGSYLKEKEFQEAEKIYLKVLGKNISHLKARLGIADLYFVTKRYAEASLNYEKALEANANLVKAHYNLGTICYFQKDFERAKEHLLKALSLYPKLLGAYLVLAQIYQLGSHTKESIQLLTKAIELSPRNPILYQKLALLYLNIREFDQAIETLNKAVALSPLDVESNVLMALACNTVQKYPEAFAAIDSALKAASQSPSPEDAMRVLLQSYTYFKSNVENV
ncbi:MAG: HEAT repeat domain-containing protein [Candidatus Riflebacteria bacterium]|nr:HEAT repeat domain-containing protein [Candidatus Riflebacteria bacterium]